jgi:hypothetical protein
MCIEHPLNNFLKNKLCIPKNNLTPCINYFTHQNTNFNEINLKNLKNFYNYDNFLVKFIDFCNKQQNYNDTIYIFTNSFPIRNITKDERDIIKKYLEPSEEMNSYFLNHIRELNLTPKQYHTIHVRSGDDFLVSKKRNESFLKTIKTKLSHHLSDDKEYFFTSDNFELNRYMVSDNKNIKTLLYDKAHTGINTHIDNYKNILLDFYIMSESNKIFSYSVYGHGSSFSKWCAEIYDLELIVL